MKKENNDSDVPVKYQYLNREYDSGYNAAIDESNEFRDAVVERLEEMDKICMICSRPSSVLLDNLIKEIKGKQ